MTGCSLGSGSKGWSVIDKKLTLTQQGAQILKMAEEKGVSTNYFFATTFRRYKTQVRILTKLEKAIREYGPLVEKEYVKGRPNLTTNPAITDYNRTATAANGTVSTLISILKSLSDESGSSDKLSEFLKDTDDG